MAVVCPNKKCKAYKKADFVRELNSTTHKTGLITTGTGTGAGWGALVAGPVGAAVGGAVGGAIACTALLIAKDYICTECNQAFRHSDRP